MPCSWIGTSGWNYRHWRGDLYPRDLPARDWLRFYAERFPTGEVNNTHYIQVKDAGYDARCDEAPDGFRFAVKAHRYITHWKRLKDTGDSLERISRRARRLGDRLGPVLFQCHPQFDRKDENVAPRAVPRDG
ncbi:MAG TPA: DUF72 domain-containing protein [Dehalococcoidia bacterium]|nr:DUF72 domain-containing protein [Dehalococcoidia bacterium]